MNDKTARCLLISKVLVADGIMTDRERAFLDHAMTRLGLSEAERRQVIDLEGWDEAEPLVANLSDAEKQATLDELAQAALADGALSPHELAAVQQIADALGVKTPG